MRRLMPYLWCGTILVAFLAGLAIGPARSTAAGQQAGATTQPAGGAPQPPALQGALPPGDYSRMQLAPDQGEPTLFAADDLRKAHVELQSRAAKSGQAVSNPRELMKPLVTRTHSFILMHRPEPRAATTSPNAELHEGVTDVYLVVAGSGTVTVGGELDNRRTVRPGEYVGPIKGGKAFKLKAGDILDIPPNMAHATVPDAGGMTYVLMKVNVGLYPWSLINGTP
jgi:mannose-6-phosphate isomerase-like protein (cupin superfamily)